MSEHDDEEIIEDAEISDEDIAEAEANEEANANKPSDDTELRDLFEAVLFLANEPLPLKHFVKTFSLEDTHAKIILDSLLDEYAERDGGVLLTEISGGFQFITNKKYGDKLRRALGFKKKEYLSKGMLETLAIIAYKQPVVLAEVDELRGVSSRLMIANLMKRNLIKPIGRKEIPGRPLAYGTTDEFLRFFGLNKLIDLPKLSEIKEFSIDNEAV